MSPHRLRLAATALLVGLASCSGPSSPVDPDPRTPDPTPPGPGLDPQITVSASAISLGFALAEAAVELRNLGGEPIDWSHAKSAGWFTATPGTGTLAGGAATTIRVAVDRTGLAPGFHSGLLQFVVGSESVAVDVSVEVQAGEPVAEVSPDALALGPDDVEASIEVTNTGDAPLHWSWGGPAWVTLQPASGTTAPGGTALVTVNPNRDGLTNGTHAATLTLDSDGGSRTVALSVAVATPPRLFISPGQVNFGSSGTSSIVALANRGGRPLNWTASADADWLALSADSGTIAPSGAAALGLTADRSGLTPGTYFATLTIDSDGGSATVTASVSVPVPQPAPNPGPNPPPPPPPSPPPSGSTALSGRVIHQFGGHGVAGLTVQFAGTTVTTDGSGTFSVPGSASSSLRDLNVSGPGIYTRSTFARTGDTEWRVVPSSFDMAAFNDVAREYEPRTIRWVAAPSVYVDVRPDAFPGGPELDQWVAEVQSQAASFVSEWTGGTISAASVQVGSSPPADGTPGTLVIHFSEDASIYGAQTTVGLARTFWTGDRSILSAIVWLRFVRFSGPANATVRSAVLGHELGHALGMGHMQGSTASIMTPSVSSNTLTSFDHDAGFLLYTRSPGNTSPDVDDAATYRGSLSPSRAPGGVYEWVCGADDRF